jgi:hypothetical protein
MLPLLPMLTHWWIRPDKKSAIAYDSICGATLCPSWPFWLLWALHLIFCADKQLLQNKYPIVTACRAFPLIFPVNNINTIVLVQPKWMNTTRQKRKIILFSVQFTPLCIQWFSTALVTCNQGLGQYYCNLLQYFHILQYLCMGTLDSAICAIYCNMD